MADDLIPIYQIKYRHQGEWYLSEFKMTPAMAEGMYEWEPWEIVPESVEYRAEGEHLYLPVDKSRRVTPREWKSRELRALLPSRA